MCAGDKGNAAGGAADSEPVPNDAIPRTEDEDENDEFDADVELAVDQTTAAEAGEGGKKSEEPKSSPRRAWDRWRAFYGANSLIVLVLCAIIIAYAYPPLGAIYLAPHVTATWIAVFFIFVMSGLGLKTNEFAKAFQRVYFNAFVQAFNFGVVSVGVYGFSRGMVASGALVQSLADGMIICASLPLTVNSVLVLTESGGGDGAAAVFNAAFGNMVGVFLSPALIFGYLGVNSEVNVGSVFFKLGLRVVLPIFIGQILQKFSQVSSRGLLWICFCIYVLVELCPFQFG